MCRMYASMHIVFMCISSRMRRNSLFSTLYLHSSLNTPLSRWVSEEKSGRRFPKGSPQPAVCEHIGGWLAARNFPRGATWRYLKTTRLSQPTYSTIHPQPDQRSTPPHFYPMLKINIEIYATPTLFYPANTNSLLFFAMHNAAVLIRAANKCARDAGRETLMLLS